jgi:hypothetical protein
LGRERLVENLVPPRIHLATPSLVRTSEAIGQERELAEYYQQIVLGYFTSSSQLPRWELLLFLAGTLNSLRTP